MMRFNENWDGVQRNRKQQVDEAVSIDDLLKVQKMIIRLEQAIDYHMHGDVVGSDINTGRAMKGLVRALKMLLDRAKSGTKLTPQENAVIDKVLADKKVQSAYDYQRDPQRYGSSPDQAVLLKNALKAIQSIRVGLIGKK